jgi:glucosylceramidase
MGSISANGYGRRSFLAGAATTGLLMAAPRWLFADVQQGSSIRVIVTSEKEKHAESPTLMWTKSASRKTLDTIAVDASQRYQPILGFGSALTDASCFLLSKMDGPARQKFLSETYSPQHMGLNFGRCAIGSSDYSRSVFNYDDVAGDVDMKHFSIAHDEEYLLPMMREIRSVNPDLFLLASPWSPPGWMKTYGSMLGGWMSAEYLAPYALYIARFIEAYGKAGVKVDAVTSQNEVETDQSGRMPAAYWTPEMEEIFVRDHLGPLLKKEKIDTQIWLLDHNYNLWKRVKWQLQDERLRQYVSGVAWHGYLGTPDMMSRLHELYPDLPFYWTEGGPDITDPNYANDWATWGNTFTTVLQNWCRGIITWNLMLDEHGEPNIGPFPCGGLVTLRKNGQITESGQYWALRHFSQHVRRNAVRVATHSDASELMHVAMVNPNGETVMVLTNTGEARTVTLMSGENSADVSLPSNSLTTLTW